MTTEPRWASVAQAHEYSGIPVSTLRRWIRQGTLPGHKIGPRRVEVDLNDLDALRRPMTTRTAGLAAVEPDDRQRHHRHHTTTKAGEQRSA